MCAEAFCAIQCQEPNCEWACRKPTNCPYPTCQLDCDAPACEAAGAASLGLSALALLLVVLVA